MAGFVIGTGPQAVVLHLWCHRRVPLRNLGEQTDRVNIAHHCLESVQVAPLSWGHHHVVREMVLALSHLVHAHGRDGERACSSYTGRFVIRAILKHCKTETLGIHRPSQSYYFAGATVTGMLATGYSQLFTASFLDWRQTICATNGLSTP